MKITHERADAVVELDGSELGAAIRAYVRDHLPTDERRTLAPPGMRPLRYATIYVSGYHVDMCGVRLHARSQAEAGPASDAGDAGVDARDPGDADDRIEDAAPEASSSDLSATPLTPDTLTNRHVRALLRADKIELDDAAIATGLCAARRGDTRRACGARIASVWNDLVDKGLICSIAWRLDPACAGRPGRPWGRVVVVVHGDPPREVHGSPDSQDRRRASECARRWATKNHLVVVDDGPLALGPDDDDHDDDATPG